MRKQKRKEERSKAEQRLTLQEVSRGRCGVVRCQCGVTGREHLQSDDNACSPSALRCAPRVLLISETGEAPQRTAAEPSLAVLGPSQTRRMPGSR